MECNAGGVFMLTSNDLVEVDNRQLTHSKRHRTNNFLSCRKMWICTKPAFCPLPKWLSQQAVPKNQRLVNCLSQKTSKSVLYWFEWIMYSTYHWGWWSNYAEGVVHQSPGCPILGHPGYQRNQSPVTPTGFHKAILPLLPNITLIDFDAIFFA